MKLAASAPISSPETTGTRVERSPSFTRSVALQQVADGVEHRLRHQRGELERDRERDDHRDDHVEPEVLERCLLGGREPAHHHAGDHVDDRQRAEQLPAQRDAARGRLEVVRQVLVDVREHRPQEQLAGEEVEHRRVGDRDERAGEDDHAAVRGQVLVDRHEDRDRDRDQRERLPARLAATKSRGNVTPARHASSEDCLVALPADPADQRARDAHQPLKITQMTVSRQTASANASVMKNSVVPGSS